MNTAQLDGESNLKPKAQVSQISHSVLKEDADFQSYAYAIQGKVVTTPPSASMTEFVGKVLLKSTTNTLVEKLKRSKSFSRSDMV